MKKLLLHILGAAWIILAADLPLAGQDITLFKIKSLQEIYSNLIRAIGESVFEAPEIRMIPAQGKVGYYDPRSNTIYIEEKLYDLCMDYGADSLNALSVILGHELAHHFENHSWAGDFGFSYRDTEVGQRIKEVSRSNRFELEAEADFFGGIYGHLAGYHTLDIWPQVIESVYEAYQIHENPKSYPSKEERIIIAQRSQQKVKEALPLFEAANWLILLGEFEVASLALTEILKLFPSREIYNNLGVSYALAAMELMDPDQLDLVHPLEFDDISRLETRGGDMGFSGDREARIQLLLSRAEEAFKRSFERDQHYFTALVNQASVLDLRGEYPLALALASKAGQQAKQRGQNNTFINAEIVRAIVLHHMGEKSSSKKILKTIEVDGHDLAKLNHSILISGIDKNQLMVEKDPTTKERLSFKTESIEELNLLDISQMEPYEYQHSLNFHHQPLEISASLYHSRLNNAQLFRLDWGLKTLLLLQCKKGYEGSTARGINIGDDLEDLRDQYGQEQALYRARNSTHYHYPRNKIVFQVDNDHKLLGWTLYALEQR